MPNFSFTVILGMSFLSVLAVCRLRRYAATLLYFGKDNPVVCFLSCLFEKIGDDTN